MRERKFPLKIANGLIQLLDIVSGQDRYPVNIQQLALEYSRERYPDHPIKLIKGDDLDGFEGVLRGEIRGDKSRWAILYDNLRSPQTRINFTIAHEFGHYLLHRDERLCFECNSRDMVNWTDDADREAEANKFAAQLLMPPHDFRLQSENQFMSFDLLQHLTNRYHVSLTAALLQWIAITTHRAVLVWSTDGYIKWSRSSDAAYKSGVYFKTVGVPPLPLPEASAAYQRASADTNQADITQCKGVWWKDEPVRELTIFSNRRDGVITLLVFPDCAPDRYAYGKLGF